MSANTGDTMTDTGPLNAKCAILSKRGPMTFEAMAEGLRMSKRTLNRDLGRLIARGFVETVYIDGALMYRLRSQCGDV